MKLFIQSAAEADILDQVEWYAQQDLPHIAQRFQAAVMDGIDALCAMPMAGPPRRVRNRRLAGLRVWPVPGFDDFWIYYLVQSAMLIVVRVLHSKRHTDELLRNEPVDTGPGAG